MKAFMSKWRLLFQNESMYVKITACMSKWKLSWQNTGMIAFQKKGFYVEMKVSMSKWRLLRQNDSFYIKMKASLLKMSFLSKWSLVGQNESFYVKIKALMSKWKLSCQNTDRIVCQNEGVYVEIQLFLLVQQWKTTKTAYVSTFSTFFKPWTLRPASNYCSQVTFWHKSIYLNEKAYI